MMWMGRTPEFNPSATRSIILTRACDSIIAGIAAESSEIRQNFAKLSKQWRLGGTGRAKNQGRNH